MVLVVPEQSQRPYRFGMTLLCVGALFNWLGLADTYSDPVPAIRYIGVGLIAAGASLICMAMCFWMRNIHDANSNGDYDISSNPIHVISSEPSLEKPPEYSTVVDVPPCYEDAIKLDATVASPIAFRLKQALRSSGTRLTNQNAEAVDEKLDHSSTSPATSPPPNPALDADNGHLRSSSLPANTKQAGKSTTATASVSPQNSSQNENTLAKVFRKSMRGVRRFRNGSSQDGNNSLQLPSNLECGSVQENNYVDVDSAKVGIDR